MAHLGAMGELGEAGEAFNCGGGRTERGAVGSDERVGGCRGKAGLRSRCGDAVEVVKPTEERQGEAMSASMACRQAGGAKGFQYVDAGSNFLSNYGIK